MKKATRLFLKKHPNAKKVDVTKVHVAGCIPNHCYQNSCLLEEKDSDNLIVLSGWIIGDYVKEQGTAAIPHYWVVDKNTHQHFDPTPSGPYDSGHYEYLLDADIFNYVGRSSILPPPILIKPDGTLKARLSNGTFIEIESVDVKHLYQLNESCKRSTKINGNFITLEN